MLPEKVEGSWVSLWFSVQFLRDKLTTIPRHVTFGQNDLFQAS